MQNYLGLAFLTLRHRFVLVLVSNAVAFNETAYIREIMAVLKYVQDQCLGEEIYLPNIWSDDLRCR